MDKLSLEQELHLRFFQQKIQKMSREQAIDFLGKLYKSMLERENLYKEILRNQWGIEKSSQETL